MLTRCKALAIGCAAMMYPGAAAPSYGQCLDWIPGFGAAQNGVNGQIYAMTVFDDGAGPALYIGGTFTSAGGVPANGVARWDGFDWTSVGTGGLGTVQGLAVYDDGGGARLYAAGQFRVVNGVTLNSIARWSGTAWQPVGGGLDNNASCLAVYDDGSGPELFVGGSFTMAGGAFTERIASWNGSRWRTWTAGPSARTRSAIAYDATRQEVVLFGGTTNGGHTGAEADTWTLDAAGWTRAATSGAGVRYGAVMTYDSTRQRTVMTAGLGSYDFANPASSWNGVAWTTIPGPFVASRDFYATAYDAARDRIVLFGGRNDNTFRNDTWEFNGSAWTQVFPTASPPVRSNHAMAYDAVRNRVVLFGGRSAEGDLGDTWEYDGATWTQVATTGPAARLGMGLAFDSLRARIVMSGGIGASPRHDTWAWDGAAWTLLDAGNPSWTFRSEPMVYDAARDLIVQRIDGRTWLFNGTTWSIPPAGGLNNDVFAMAVHDDGSGPALYVGGMFTTAAGLSTSGIARLTGAGWSAVGTGGGANGVVNAVASHSGALYVGGSFSNVGNIQANNIASWNGAAWSPVGAAPGGAGVNNPVMSLCSAELGSGGGGARLYAGGTFTHASGVPAQAIARWDGTAWSALGTGLNAGAIPRSLARYDDGGGARLYVAGSITTSGGLAARNIAAYGSTCSAPVVTLPPQHTTAVLGQPVVLTVTAIGTGPLSYQWRRNGVDLADEPSHIFGALTNRLEIQGVSLSDAGSYDVVVTNTYGSETSDPATLTVPLAGVAGPVSVTRVLVPPEPVPGAPGDLFTSLASPLVSPTGEVTFEARINGVRSLSRWDAGELSVAFRAGQQAPGVPPGNSFALDNSGISSFQAYASAEDWKVAFTADLQGPDITGPGDRRGVWYADSEGAALVARAGSPAPGVTPFLFHATPRLGGISDSGVVAFQSIYSVIPNGNYAGAGIWAWSASGGLVLHARTGATAPGTSAAFTFINEPPRVNAAGDIIFNATLDSLTGFNYAGADSGIWLGPATTPAVVARSGDPSPGFTGYNIETPLTAILNDAGEVLFRSTVAGPSNARSEALYLWSTLGLELVAKRGDAAPGASPTQTFVSLTPVAFNSNGQAVVQALLAGPGPTWGFWFLDDDGSLAPIVLRDQIGLPGLPSPSRLEAVETVALNALGQVVLMCNVSAGTSARAIFGWTPDVELFPIVVPGTQIEIAKDVFRTATNAYLSSTIGGQSGLESRALNDDGRLVFQTEMARVGGLGVFVGQFNDFLGGYINCPLFTSEPMSTAAPVGGAAILQATAVGAGDLTRQWRKNGVPLVDSARISGAATDTLTIADAQLSDAGTYDMIVTNDCGVATSAAAVLDVYCRADWNRSGTVNSQDFFDFLQAFFQNLESADFNADRFVNSQDFFDFLGAFFAGC